MVILYTGKILPVHFIRMHWKYFYHILNLSKPIICYHIVMSKFRFTELKSVKLKANKSYTNLAKEKVEKKE